MNPYYDDGTCVIYHGDCRDIIGSLSPPGVMVGEHDAGSSRLESDLGTGSLGSTPASLRVDLLLADPPYNVGCPYDLHDDRMGPDEYVEWCREWWLKAEAATSRQVVFPGHGNLSQWWHMGGLRTKPSGVGCWYKPGNPAGGGVFQHCEWEPFLLFGAAKGIPDVIRATVSNQSGVGDHPCPKPLPLYRTVLSKGKVASVVDPFMGSGTTLRAAKDLGIPAVGIDISERYCEIAARRLAQEVLDFGSGVPAVPEKDATDG